MNLTSADILAAKADLVLQKAAQLGASQCMVQVSESIEQNVQYRKGELEELTREQQIDLSIVVYRGTQQGQVSISDWGENALDEAVRAALQSSEFTDPDPAEGLVEPQFLAGAGDVSALQLLHPVPELAQLQDYAARLESAAFAHDKRIANSEGATASAGVTQFWLATSDGFVQGYAQSYVSGSVSVLAKDGDEQQSAYAYDSRRAAEDLAAPETLGAEAARKACAALNPRPIATGEYPVLYRPEMATGLIGHLLAALGGTTQYRRLGFLPDSIGQRVLPAWLDLCEQPLLPRGNSSAPFDGEGVPVRAPEIVRAGEIQRYLLGSYSARRLGMTPTGNVGGVHNLQLLADAAHVLPAAELLRALGRGVIITSLMGQGVNGLTGDYSRGATGFWVENGEIVHPVAGITVAGNLKEMLANIVAIGDDINTRGRIFAPSILLEKMTVAQ